MRVYRSRSRTVMACVVAGFTVTSLLPNLAFATPLSDAAALQLTGRYLQDRADRITESVTGSSVQASTLTTAPASSSFKAHMAREAPLADAFRQRWARTAFGYDKATVRTENPNFTRTGNGATLTVDERTDLHFTRRPGPTAPKETSYRVGHIIKFVLDGGQWQIASDVLDLPDHGVEPIPYFGAVRSGGRGDVVSAPAKNPLSSNSEARPSRALSGPYQRQDMANYALQWALDRNGNYPTFGNDCTNFVSQALKAGGWEDTTTPGTLGEPTNPSNWYMRYFPPRIGWSNSWTVANELRRFALDYSEPRRAWLGVVKNQIADLVFADWDLPDGSPGVDGNWDHVMIITAASDPDSTSWEDKFVSYHTTDTLNVPLQQVWEKANARSSNFGFYFAGLNFAS